MLSVTLRPELEQLRRMESSFTDVRKAGRGEGLEGGITSLVLDIFYLGYLLNFPAEVLSR